ncbi:MAG: putative rane protein [Marmoricola sp.]|nr:putative rane protein [Marmoricola sp.]
MTDEPPVVRVRVTGPRGGRPRPMSGASQIDARTDVGDIYMRALMRTQLRLALGVTAVVLATIGLLPVAFTLFGGFGTTTLLGIPLPWLLLGGGVYPVLIALAWVFVRRAERNEQAFLDLIRPK